MAAPMLGSALRELKYHASRYVATLVAIAISVGFLAAASIITTTESNAAGVQEAQPYASGDMVVSPVDGPYDVGVDTVTAAISSVPGVRDTEAVPTFMTILENDTSMTLAVILNTPSQDFQWTSLKEGTWPQGAQIALSSQLAKDLGVTVGDEIVASGRMDYTVTVSGITAVANTTVASSPALVDPAWASGNLPAPYLFQTAWVLKLAPGADPAQVGQAVTDSLSGLGLTITAQTTKDYVQEASLNAMHNVDGMKYMLWIFAGIAMVVGMITIANTFTILLAQRRRQTGLIRSIGASGGQVRRSIWLEALVLGLVGAVVGVGLACALAAGLGLYTGSIVYGLKIPWGDTLAAMGLGLVITFVAAVVPARRATKVSPIEALQPTTSAVHTSKLTVVRVVVCSLLFVVGLAGCFYSLKGGSSSLLIAVAGAMLTALGVLFGARIFVPSLLRLAGVLVRRMGPSASVAAKNVARDPARASATATALMLAVGLIITLQVGAASMSTTMKAKIDSEYPVDVYVSAYDVSGGASMAGSLDEISHIPGVGKVASIPCQALPSGWEQIKVCSYVPEVAALSSGLPSSVPDARILFSEQTDSSGTVTLGSSTLTIETAPVVMNMQYAFVSPAVYGSLDGQSYDASLIFVSIADSSKMASVMKAVQDMAGDDSTVGGSALEKSQIEQMMNIVVGVVTALLAVAVLIALVGVGNTLTLSVIERARENAILRALGFQTRQLKLMLLIEALLLTLVGGAVGLAAGTFFGWIGATALVSQFRAEGILMNVQFALDWPQTLGLLAVLVVAAALASLLPGRRAAKASPVEALADI